MPFDDLFKSLLYTERPLNELSINGREVENDDEEDEDYTTAQDTDDNNDDDINLDDDYEDYTDAQDDTPDNTMPPPANNNPQPSPAGGDNEPQIDDLTNNAGGENPTGNTQPQDVGQDAGVEVPTGATNPTAGGNNPAANNATTAPAGGTDPAATGDPNAAAGGAPDAGGGAEGDIQIDDLTGEDLDLNGDPGAGGDPNAAGADPAAVGGNVGGGAPAAGGGGTGADPNADPNAQPQDPNTGGNIDTGNEDPNSLKSLEKDLFANLTPQQLNIKNAALLQDYIDMYDSLEQIFDNINKVPKTFSNGRVLGFIADKFVELKDLVNTIITTTYITRTYVENEAIYKQCLLMMHQLNTMLKGLLQKDSK